MSLKFNALRNELAQPGASPAPSQDTGNGTATASAQGQESEDILNYYSPDEAEEIRAAAETTGKSVNFIVSETAKYGIQRMYHDKYGNETNPYAV